MMVLGLLAVSIIAFADGPSCNVRGANGTVYVVRENAQSNDYGTLSVALETNSKQNVRVIIKIYDAYTDEVVKVESISVEKDRTTYKEFYGLKKNHPYYFRLSDAHCG